MSPVPDRGDDPRHEPEALSPLPPAAARAPEPPARRSRRAPRRRHHHRLGERQARHRPALQLRSGSRARGARSRGAVVHARARPGDARSGCGARYGLDERIILYVGTIEPRKNLPTLIDAFAARQRSGALRHQLVCVGPYGWLSRGIEAQIERAGSAGAIKFTGYVPFDDLPASTASPRCSCSRRCTRGSACRWSRRWRAASPVITGRTAALSEVGGGAIVTVDRLDRRRAGRRAGRHWRRAATAARNCRGAASRAPRRSRGSAPRARPSRSIARRRTRVHARSPDRSAPRRLRRTDAGARLLLHRRRV